MRNFKKFLALVLAMLMVSACAVSVSAAYADQTAIDATGYADAVEVLTILGVIAGDGTNFNPNDTLTRAQAAKIAAMLTAGSAGKKIEWKSATSSFIDVDPAHWGNAYINYASQRGFMDGIGDNKFAPDATLTIAEAITIAVKVAGLRSEVAEMEELYGKPAYWAAYWIAVAGGDYEPAEGEDAINLIGNKITVFDYSAPCTRAMFAQIAYNMLNNVAKIKNGFGLDDAQIEIKYADDKIVYGTDVETNAPVELDLAAFLAKAEAAGVTVSDINALVGSYVTITYNKNNTSELYGVALDSTATVYTYADAKIANVKYTVGDEKKNDKYITIDGVKYVVAASGEEVGVGAIGSASSKVPAINVTVVDANASSKTYQPTEWNVTATNTAHRLPSIPTYYKAVAYDDNGDAKFDRLVINKYEIARIDYDYNPDKNKATDGVAVDYVDFVSSYVDFSNHDGKPAAKEEKAIVYTGVENAAKDEALPMLVKVSYYAGNDKYYVDILETAKTVTGVVSNLKTNVAANTDKYITIGTTSVKFAKDIVKDPESWTLGQNVTIYTIGGKYVNVAAASSGIESGSVNKTVLVDKATIVDGKAVISGYYYGAAFEAVTLNVTGVVDANGKLKARNAYLDDAAKHTDYNGDGVIDTTLPDFNKDNKVDDADKAFASVVLGTSKKDGVVADALVIEDNTFYDIVITSEGAYLEAVSTKNFPRTTPANKVTIDGSYIKNTIIDAADDKEVAVAQYRLAGSYVVVTEAPADTTKAYNYYSDSYTVATTIPANTTASYGVVDDKFAVVDSTNASTKNVSLIYISSISKVTVAETVAGLAEGMTIVQILSVENEALDFNTYKAQDIFTGAVVEVTGEGAVEGDFVTAVNGVINTVDTKWVGTFTVTATETLGKIESAIAYNSYLLGKKDGADATLKFYSNDANKVSLGLDNLTVWKYDNGKLVADSEFTFADGTNTVFGFINGGKAVIIPNP